MSRRSAWFACSIGLLLAAAPMLARQTAQSPRGCRPPAPPTARLPNIFTEDQENDLGDIVNEWVGREFRVIDDAAITAFLARIGERVVRHLPESRLHFQFFLIDLPDPNAEAMPGGRIYISRKLVAFARSEDELAGAIAHEAGHLIARQYTARLTRQLKEVLGVTAVTDRADILEQFNRLMDNAARKPAAFQVNEQDDQIEADQMALFATAAAGYDPEAHVRLLERLLGVRGRTGPALGGTFGAATPDAARLRELTKSMPAVPAGCIAPNPPASAGAFERWQADVASYTGLARKEALPGVVKQTSLSSPLSGDVTSLRFSPDGRLVMAMDDTGVTLLGRDPFQVQFRIEASDVAGAAFSPDSSSLWIYTTDLRVERWDLAQRVLADVREVFLRRPCLQIAMAADGKALGCFDDDYGVSLVDIASGEVLYEKRPFSALTPLDLARANVMRRQSMSPETGYISMGFSPDGRYFAAANHLALDDAAVVYDVWSRAAVALKPDARRLLAGGFVFTGTDRLVAHNWRDEKHSAVIALPSGDSIETVVLFGGRYQPAAKGPFVFVRPFQRFAVAVMDLNRRLVVKGIPNPAVDIYDDWFVAERGTGEVGLYGMNNQLVAAAALPRAALSRLRAASVSADFKWLAVSGRTRGELWDLADGRAVTQTRGFTSASFTPDDAMLLDLPAQAGEPRRLLRIDPSERQSTGERDVRDDGTTLLGPYQIVRRPAKRDTSISDGYQLEVRDAASGASLWSRMYETDPPALYTTTRSSEFAVLAWPLTSPRARAIIKDDLLLRDHPIPAKIPDADHLLEVVDLKSGLVRGRMWFESGAGSFDLGSVIVSGDTVAISDTASRVHVYSLSTGTLLGRVFGTSPVISRGAGLLAVENGAGALVIYDLATFKRRQELSFSHSLVLERFSPGGTRLFVLTADQTTYVFDLPSIDGPSKSASPGR